MTSVDVVIKEKSRLLKLLGERMCLLQAQDALLLLHQSLAIMKVLHVLQSSPCFASTLLSDFDDLLRDILSDVINVCLELGPAWLQASLPVCVGGIGIRSAAQLVCPLCRVCRDHLEPGTQPSSPPTPPTTHRQRAWDAPSEALQRTLLESSRDPPTRARLLAAATKKSGARLNTLPVTSLGLRLYNEVVRVAVGLRLGLPLCCPHQCTHCEAEVNDWGTHGLSCHFSKGCHSRHGAVNDVVKRSLEAAKIPAHLEPTDIYRSDGMHTSASCTHVQDALVCVIHSYVYTYEDPE